MSAPRIIVERTAPHKELLSSLEKTTVGMLDRKVKHGQHLTFEEAFCGMCYVLAATNVHFYKFLMPAFEKANGTGFSKEKSLAIASAFLNLMATKEALSVLTHEEIAGMVLYLTSDLASFATGGVYVVDGGQTAH